MAEVSYKFDLDEDREILDVIHNASRMHSALIDIDNALKARLKHEDISETEYDFLDKLRELSFPAWSVGENW